jgi:hypothetical protein
VVLTESIPLEFHLSERPTFRCVCSYTFHVDRTIPPRSDCGHSAAKMTADCCTRIKLQTVYENKIFSCNRVYLHVVSAAVLQFSYGLTSPQTKSNGVQCPSAMKDIDLSFKVAM